MEIHDNGKGISHDKIVSILEGRWKNKNRLDKNIGIKNVIKRIKLNHGNKYDLKIESKHGEYTIVKYFLPVIEEIPDNSKKNTTEKIIVG